MSFALRPVSSVSRICSAASHFRASPSQSRLIHTSRTGVNVSRFAAVPISGPALGVASQPWLRLRGMSVASGSHTSSTVGLKEAQQSQTVDSGVGAPGYKLPAQVEGTIAVKIDGRYSSHPALEQHEKIVNSEDPTANNYLLPHPLWNGEYVLNVHYTHLPPKDNVDKLAMYTIKAIRFNFDWMSGYTFGRLTETKALTRIMFLETVAGVPGSIGGTLRHLASLRRMKRDGGWIRTLLDEAENERMHLLTALALRKPGAFMRALVLLTQGVFYNFFWISYMISPRFCHRLVGYLEEEAVATYTKILNQIDAPNGSLTAWKTLPAPEIAKKYWSLPDNATFRDVLAYIRADEAHHRDVNHKLASIPKDALNPFRAEH